MWGLILVSCLGLPGPLDSFFPSSEDSPRPVAPSLCSPFYFDLVVLQYFLVTFKEITSQKMATHGSNSSS
jgi:hypothetical protein